MGGEPPAYKDAGLPFPTEHILGPAPRCGLTQGHCPCCIPLPTPAATAKTVALTPQSCLALPAGPKFISSPLTAGLARLGARLRQQQRGKQSKPSGARTQRHE